MRLFSFTPLVVKARRYQSFLLFFTPVVDKARRYQFKMSFSSTNPQAHGMRGQPTQADIDRVNGRTQVLQAEVSSLAEKLKAATLDAERYREDAMGLRQDNRALREEQRFCTNITSENQRLRDENGRFSELLTFIHEATSDGLPVRKRRALQLDWPTISTGQGYGDPGRSEDLPAGAFRESLRRRSRSLSSTPQGPDISAAAERSEEQWSTSKDFVTTDPKPLAMKHQEPGGSRVTAQLAALAPRRRARKATGRSFGQSNTSDARIHRRNQSERSLESLDPEFLAASVPASIEDPKIQSPNYNAPQLPEPPRQPTPTTKPPPQFSGPIKPLQGSKVTFPSLPDVDDFMAACGHLSESDDEKSEPDEPSKISPAGLGGSENVGPDSSTQIGFSPLSGAPQDLHQQARGHFRQTHLDSEPSDEPLHLRRRNDEKVEEQPQWQLRDQFQVSSESEESLADDKI